MATPTMTISLPAPLRKYIEVRVRTAGYGSVSEYMRELIRRDLRLQLRPANNAADGPRSQGTIPPLPARNTVEGRPPLASAARYDGRRRG
jgi:Arc/MetJ-type ribon-helix-helix transcriptional regulator